MRSRRARARSYCSSTSCTPSSARARPRAAWTRATCSSPCWRAASCTASARRPSTNTASIWRRIRRWSVVSSRYMVDEPTVEDTISILRGLKERYEVFHGVKISDQALVSAAKLSNRYITDRFLPDKAIDLVDEACAMIRTEIDSMPQEMDDISREIMQQRNRRGCAGQGGRRFLPQSAGARAKRAEGAAREVRRHEGQVGDGEEVHRHASRSCARRSSRPTPTLSARSANTI